MPIPHETYKIQIAKIDYFDKQFGRASVALERLEEIEQIHGKEAIKEALYQMYTEVLDLQTYN